MIPIRPVFKVLCAAACVMGFVSCATELEKKESRALSAGFKVITPHTPDQVALLPRLPAKMSLINYRGKPVYVLPDVKKNQAYVGGLTQYEAYCRLRNADQRDEDEPETTHVAELNFGGWDGANAVGR